MSCKTEADSEARVVTATSITVKVPVARLARTAPLHGPSCFAFDTPFEYASCYIQHTLLRGSTSRSTPGVDGKDNRLDEAVHQRLPTP